MPDSSIPTAASVAAARIQRYRASLTPRMALILTLWGEARGETPNGQIAIAQLIERRRAMGRWGHTWTDVCLFRSQFSCWWLIGGQRNADAVYDRADAWLAHPDRMPSDLDLQAWVADGLRLFPALAPGADHYLTKSLFATKPPTWAMSARIVAAIDQHYFLKV